MKKLLYTSLSLLICLFSINYETNACTSFDLDYTFTTSTAGTTVTVTWTSTGCPSGAMVDISLIDVNANAIAQYYPGVANSGSLSVTLGAGLPPGPYRFYVQYAPSWPPEAWDYGPDFDIVIPTPVELTYFNGKKVDNTSVELTWQTASEMDNKGFDIEYSENGEDWRTIDFVEGNGESLLLQNYEFVHRSSQSEMNYYRLKQLDFSGDFSYSSIVSVRLTDKYSSDISVYPNPCTDFIHLADASIENFDYRLVNSIGKTILSNNSSSSQIDVSQLGSGIYRILIYSNKQEVYSGSFIKR